MMQIDVNDGLAIRGPRAALTGLTYAGLEATKTSKPPIASELLMKTPIVKVLPTPVALKVRGTCGQLLLVARVKQTRPVPGEA